jgi:flagellar hook-associated protein 3 FlgL
MDKAYMRVNPNIAPNILNALFQTQDQEQTALEQLSTQKRVNVPSDDPLAAAQVVANQDQTAQAAQYLQNIDTLTVQMQTADSALSSVVTALTQAINIGVQGSDGTLPATNLQQLAQTVQSIQSQLVQLGNTSISGTYLFGGTATTTPPFTLDPSSASGVTYNGNNNVNNIDLGNGSVLQANVPGSQLFQNAGGDVFNSIQQLITALQSGNTASVATATTQVRTAFDQLTTQRGFYGDGINQLSATQGFLQQEQITLSSQENNLVGVDLAQVATELTQAQTAHQAALAAAARILPTTLLDYLR